MIQRASIQENLAEVRERVARAAIRAGRTADDIMIVAASKGVPAEAIREAYHLGLRHFGENRVQEREAKEGSLGDLRATWHLIGGLQSNKVRRAVRIFHRIDSVDSLDLARRLNQAWVEIPGGIGAPRNLDSSTRLPVLIEVQLAPEESKRGARPEDVGRLVEEILSLRGLALQGLMCIPPYAEDPEQVRPDFAQLAHIRDAMNASKQLSMPVLSMGMSHDFEAAIEEGATEVRIGTAIFGLRRFA